MTTSQLIIYQTQDGNANVSLLAKDGNVWMNQNQLAELFDTSKQNIGQHIKSVLEDKELDDISVVKNYFTTADDGKNYEVAFYSLDMILAIGFKVRSKRGTQFRIWANQNLKQYIIKGFVIKFTHTFWRLKAILKFIILKAVSQTTTKIKRNDCAAI